MNTWSNVSASLVLARAVHFGACLLLLNIWIFDRFIAAPAARLWPRLRETWRSIAKILIWLSLPTTFLSGIFWFFLVARGMSGLPFAQAIHPTILAEVWNQTVFGAVWKLRLLFWVGTTVFSLLALRRPLAVWLATLFAALLSASLAWAGHAQTGRAVPWHLAADVLHLLFAAIWPVGLLPLLLVLLNLRRSNANEKWLVLHTLVQRFSITSLISVGVLIATGYANALLLIGSFSNLFHMPYGRLLLIKIALFLTMIVIGFINMNQLKPRLMRGGSETARQLQLNVAIELALAMLILVVIGVLGLLPPSP
ncbi:MAG TPA: CopD family protein [Tepidisphaeraceae bacterium]|nr:CopD family protein [Tepidisphaeraceae bacterium]